MMSFMILLCARIGPELTDKFVILDEFVSSVRTNGGGYFRWNKCLMMVICLSIEHRCTMGGSGSLILCNVHTEIMMHCSSQPR